MHELPGERHRSARQAQNGEDDPADFRLHELCEKCGGGGMCEVNKTPIAERKPGNIADTFG